MRTAGPARGWTRPVGRGRLPPSGSGRRFGDGKEATFRHGRHETGFFRNFSPIATSVIRSRQGRSGWHAHVFVGMETGAEALPGISGNSCPRRRGHELPAVSYTHLTLPTKRIV